MKSKKSNLLTLIVSLSLNKSAFAQQQTQEPESKQKIAFIGYQQNPSERDIYITNPNLTNLENLTAGNKNLEKLAIDSFDISRGSHIVIGAHNKDAHIPLLFDPKFDEKYIPSHSNIYIGLIRESKITDLEPITQDDKTDFPQFVSGTDYIVVRKILPKREGLPEREGLVLIDRDGTEVRWLANERISFFDVSSDGKEVVYSAAENLSSDSKRLSDLKRVSINGEMLRNITNTENIGEIAPASALDGRIAYAVWNNWPEASIFIIEQNPRRQIEIYHSLNIKTPRFEFSPDGNQIWTVANYNNDSVFGIIDVNAKKITYLSSPAVEIYSHPSFYSISKN